ncbi:MAG: phosphotransferase [Candidatus Paceibacterota bacterium]
MIPGDDMKEFLRDTYGLKEPSFFGEVSHGYAAENFLIQDGESKYFLKKYNKRRKLERLLEIHKVERFLSENNVPAIAPLPNEKGETLSTYQGRFFAIFPYVEGRQFDHLPPQKSVTSAGETLARLHKATKDATSLVVLKKFDTWNKEDFLREANEILLLIEGGENTPFDLLARDFLKLKMKLAEESSVTVGTLKLEEKAILHGDYHHHNLFFGKDDKVSHVFDFERTAPGPRTIDVAYGLFLICFDYNLGREAVLDELHFSRAMEYLRGYQSVFPLSQDELKAGIEWFYWCKCVHHVWPLDRHYKEKEYRADVFVGPRLQLINYFSKNLNSILALVDKV